MPSAAAFRRGFGIPEKDAVLPGSDFVVERVSVGHEAKEAYERYEFPIELELRLAPLPEGRFSPRKAKKELLSAIKEHVSGKKIIYSEYGSPYECHFGEPTIGRMDIFDDGVRAEVRSRGWAVRRRDLPTQKQQTEERERSAGTEREKMKNDAEKRGFRIIRSHFGTSHCPACGKEISVGEWIARKEAAAGPRSTRRGNDAMEKEKTSRGGWLHLACAE